MKRFVVIFCCTLLAASLAFAQEPKQEPKKPEAPKADAAKPETKPAAPLPTVDQIIDKYVTALGGKEAVEKLNARVTKGTFEIPAMGANGTFESFAKAPNKNAAIITVPGFGTVHQIFDGKTAWAADPMTGLRELAGAELAAQKRDSEFHRDIKLKQLYPKMEVKGKDKVGAVEAYVIVATPADGEPEKFYFDAASGLLLRQDAERDSPQGKMPIEIYFEDYRAVDGVKMPFVMKETNPAFNMTIKLEEVKHNVAVDDAKFNKPAAQ